MSPRAYLGLGSNLGDRLKTLQSASTLLNEQPDLHVVASSRVWETDPIGPAQPDFLNVVLEVETTRSPHALLEAARFVEAALHRERIVRWGPRTIDIDILFIDGVSVDEPTLIVPHPRLMDRAFVVLPFMELAPDLVLPDGVALRDARAAGGARPFAPPLRLADRP